MLKWSDVCWPLKQRGDYSDELPADSGALTFLIVMLSVDVLAPVLVDIVVTFI